MSKYRKKLIVVAAIQFKQGNFDQIRAFAGNASKQTGSTLCINTGDMGMLYVKDGDWIVKENGRFILYTDYSFNEHFEAYSD